MAMVPYNRAKARDRIISIFSPMIADAQVLSSPSLHLEALRKLADTLPLALKPTKMQLSTPHSYAIDMLASPSLRDRLLNVSADVAQAFITDFACCKGDENADQLLVWGEDPLNEMAWEFSQAILQRWGWLLGPEWTLRANFWRRQRGAPLLNEW